MEVRRFEVFLVALDPTRGSEMRKSRPGVVISPDETNGHIATVIIAPLTSKKRKYPTRVDCVFQGKPGQVVLDQIRTVDKSRLLKALGRVSTTTGARMLEGLREMFAP